MTANAFTLAVSTGAVFVMFALICGLIARDMFDTRRAMAATGRISRDMRADFAREDAARERRHRAARLAQRAEMARAEAARYRARAEKYAEADRRAGTTIFAKCRELNEAQAARWATIAANPETFPNR